VGDRFDAAGVTVSVSGIINAEENSQNNSVAFVHLPFLQQASKLGLGIVTQFNVKVENADLLGEVAASIDERFKSDTDPTATQPEKAFFASTALELLELIRFSRWIGWACALAIVGLIANSILLTVRNKISEHSVLKTLGFSRLLLSWMIITEGLLLSLIGGIIGISLACLFLLQQSISIGNEGLILAFLPSTSVVINGLWVSSILGILAGVYPAWLAGRHSIAESLRAL
jgi:putative ABC transport system permease protein